ncbi:MAG: carboxylating nicotinate-nucleotide diphosphorylase [Leptospiraceae bacterium]|nr:carboxylating nicotinate-nucleotide diphosphorylase [Leptospiraceae bacterium]MCP5498923.1 carboxylating nicotinate-nucleotide diphosphorylase [Leptospiraceae bacterium]
MRYHYTSAVETLQREDFSEIVRLALEEDCPAEDITSVAIFSPEVKCSARLISREPGILCGIPVLNEINLQSGNVLELNTFIAEGKSFCAGDIILQIRGNLLDVLRLERLILNFLQYLSGIATQTAELVNSYPGIYILDTRKTLPGYRKMVKYAVFCGGGSNHRIHLSDMAMIKDNHVAMAGSMKQAVEKIRSRFPGKKVELEIDSLAQLTEAMDAEPDILLLDNFSIQDTREAVHQVQQKKASILIECSGGITPDKLAELSRIGGIGVSMGYLTHTTRFLDLSLDLEKD